MSLYRELVFAEFNSSYKMIKEKKRISIKKIFHDYFIVDNQLYLFLTTGIMILPLSKSCQSVYVYPSCIVAMTPCQVKSLASNKSLSKGSREQLMMFVDRLEYRLQTLPKKMLKDIKTCMVDFSKKGTIEDVRILGIYFWQYSEESEDELLFLNKIEFFELDDDYNDYEFI